MHASESHINLEITSHISPLPQSRPSAHLLTSNLNSVHVTAAAVCLSLGSLTPAVPIQGAEEQMCEMGAATGIGPCDHSQPVAHMSSLSSSARIKSALFVLQN